MSNCSDCSDNRLFTLERFAGDRIDGGPPCSGANRGHRHQDRDQPDEDQNRIGQGVA